MRIDDFVDVRALVARALAALAAEGIQRCHLFVFRDNEPGAAFWLGSDWTERPELRVLSRELEGGEQ